MPETQDDGPPAMPRGEHRGPRPHSRRRELLTTEGPTLRSATRPIDHLATFVVETPATYGRSSDKGRRTFTWSVWRPVGRPC